MTRRVVATAFVMPFGAMLLGAAFLKLQEPYPAAHALGWIGLELPVRILIVDAVCLVEALLGGLLLVGIGHRATLLFGAVAALGLLVAHAMALAAAGVEECGCFGNVPVPDSVVLGVSVAGLLGSTALARMQELPIRLPRITFGLAASVAAMIPLWTRPAVSVETPERRLLRFVPAPFRGANAVAMVGSWSCEHCRAAVAEIAQAREIDPFSADLQLLVLVRRDDRTAPREQASWIDTTVIPSDLWWAALERAPPAFFGVGSDGVPRLQQTWR